MSGVLTRRRIRQLRRWRLGEVPRASACARKIFAGSIPPPPRDQAPSPPPTPSPPRDAPSPPPPQPPPPTPSAPPRTGSRNTPKEDSPTTQTQRPRVNPFQAPRRSRPAATPAPSGRQPTGALPTGAQKARCPGLTERRVGRRTQPRPAPITGAGRPLLSARRPVYIRDQPPRSSTPSFPTPFPFAPPVLVLPEPHRRSGSTSFSARPTLAPARKGSSKEPAPHRADFDARRSTLSDYSQPRPSTASLRPLRPRLLAARRRGTGGMHRPARAGQPCSASGGPGGARKHKPVEVRIRAMAPLAPHPPPTPACVECLLASPEPRCKPYALKDARPAWPRASTSGTSARQGPRTPSWSAPTRCT